MNHQLEWIHSPSVFFGKSLYLICIKLYNYEFFKRNVITKAFENSEKSGILTTHSMEEAEALCQRIGIMVKGELK